MASGTRQRDVVAMAVSEILLLLLKHFRRTSVLAVALAPCALVVTLRPSIRASQPLQYMDLASRMSDSVKTLFQCYIQQDLKAYLMRQDPLDDPVQAEVLCNATPRAAARALAGKHRSAAAVNQFCDEYTGYVSVIHCHPTGQTRCV